MTNVYIELTKFFNAGELRAILSFGQAAVLHRLAIMSKDGDWILRETAETMEHILKILSKYKAHYRFGAPLDIRWMSGGWSSHFEFLHGEMRVRTDFVTRPPRISQVELRNLWKGQEGCDIPFVSIKHLADIKKTNRERDYAIIGELARLMSDPRDQLLYSRSARDLIALAEKHPAFISELKVQRSVLEKIPEGRDKLEEALDAERRSLIHVNEERLRIYMEASLKWSVIWQDVEKETEGISLLKAHEIVVRRAKDILPFHPMKG